MWHEFFKLFNVCGEDNSLQKKGIILAAGKGRRLHPFTKVVPKALLPIGKKFLIDYSIELLRGMGINDIAIVVNPEQAGLFMKVYGNRFSYISQESANGIAGGLKVCEDWADGGDITVVLGDTIFKLGKYPGVFSNGARCFSYEVENPYWCGCVERENGKVINLVEKPGDGYTKSKEVLIGLYQYDATVFERIEDLEYSARGELEITDLNRSYLEDGELEVVPFDGLWYDAGTDMDSYLGAWNLI